MTGALYDMAKRMKKMRNIGLKGTFDSRGNKIQPGEVGEFDASGARAVAGWFEPVSKPRKKAEQAGDDTGADGAA